MKQIWGKWVDIHYDGEEGDEILGKITYSMPGSWKFIVHRILVNKDVYGMTES